MNIDMIALQAFIAVAETNSFTKAAKQIGRTQSAISQQITKLESLFEKRMFVRGKDFELTLDGEIFLAYARQITALHREMIDRFKEPDLAGELRFGLPEDFASVFLSDVLVDFTRAHARVLLKVECDLTLNLLEKFKRNKYDMVLVKLNNSGDFPNGHTVWSEPLQWVGNGDLIKPDKPIPLVLSPFPCVYRQKAIDALENVSLPWRLVFSSTSYAGTVAAVKAGMGITVLPHAMIPGELGVIEQTKLPVLENTHVSLLKRSENDPVINSLETFVLKKLKY